MYIASAGGMTTERADISGRLQATVHENGTAGHGPAINIISRIEADRERKNIPAMRVQLLVDQPTGAYSARKGRPGRDAHHRLAAEGGGLGCLVFHGGHLANR